MIDAGVTDYVVAPHTPKELADKVEILLTNHVLRKRMGKAGRHRVERLFSQDEDVKRILVPPPC